MLSSRVLSTSTFVRFASQEGKKRFMRTVPMSNKSTSAPVFGSLNYSLTPELQQNNDTPRTWAKHSLNATLPGSATAETSRWAKHSLGGNSRPQSEEISISSPRRSSRTSRFKSKEPAATKPEEAKATEKEAKVTETKEEMKQAPVKNEELPKVESEVAVAAEKPAEKTVEKKPRRKLRPRKALITLTPNAVANLRRLLEQPEPQLIRIGVKNRGCSGLTYHLEYVSEPGKFDETVEQDGVKVLIDSKALFSIVGSEMDWLDDKLSSRFIFRNPNSKGTCGCGESFMV